LLEDVILTLSAAKGKDPSTSFSGRRYLPAVLAVAGALALLSGCKEPPWELRTFHANASGVVYTDDGSTTSASWQYAMSRVAGRWVCPFCGYSTANVADPSAPPYCPNNPWAVPDTPDLVHANARLQFQPVDRCFLSTTGRPVTLPSPPSPPGSSGYAVVGRPFHPTTGTNTAGSIVRIAAAGIENNPNVASGDFVRFLVLQPGARFPAASLPRDAAGALVMGPSSGDTLDDIGITTTGVHINPFRVTNGEVYYVQFYRVWYFADDGMGNATVTKVHAAVRVYSTLDGLVSFIYRVVNSSGPVPACSLVAATGSVRLDIPAANAPAYTGALPGTVVENQQSAFRIVSNSRLIPGLGEDPTTDPTDWTAVPVTGDPPVPAWPWNEDAANPPTQDWPTKASYFRIPAPGPPTNGIVADWDPATPVVGSSAPVANPYVIPSAAVGKGWVIAEWQNADAPTIITGSPTTKQTLKVGTTAPGTDWFWDEKAEWNYDWLVETHTGANDPATYAHLWSNCYAAAHCNATTTPDSPLQGFHIETTDADHYQATNYVPYFATSFISSRLQVPPTAQSWDKDGTGSTVVPLETDTDLARGTATVLIGQGAPSGGNVTGSYQPGTTTDTRTALANNRMTQALKCPACGSVLATGTNPSVPSGGICPYCGQTGLNTAANLRIPGDAVTAVSMQDPLSLPTPSPRTGAASRPGLTEGALASDASAGWYAAGAVGSPFTLALDLPAYLPPSVPMLGTNPAANNLIADPGYFGRLVMVHRPQFYAGQAAGSTEATPDNSLRNFAVAVVSWWVSGAGDSTYNGLYTDTGSTYGGQHYYTKASPVRYLWYDGSIPQWCLSATLGVGADYGGQANQQSLPANSWAVTGGTAPAPTLSVEWRYNHHWDAFYRCLACGAWNPQPGSCWNPSCPGTQMCPVCAIPVPIPVPTSVTTCPFCGHALVAWGAGGAFAGVSRVSSFDLDTEEYEPFNAIVSVLRKLDLSRTMATLDLGRVAPGVPATAPDTTVGGSAVPQAAPSDVTTPDVSQITPAPVLVLPGRRFDVLNEGNVMAPGLLRDTDLVRAGTDLDFGVMSYPARVAAVPLPWQLLFPSGLGVGLAASVPGGAAGGASTAYLQAGTRLTVPVQPIPLGQPAGVHTGRVIVFTDLNADGQLNFYRIGIGVTSTAATVFDPAIDLPFEPVADFDVRLRVAEGRIPQDDYFSADVAPSIAFDLDSSGVPTTLHLVWMGNRVPAGSVGATASPGTSPAALPTTTSPFNLLYSDAAASLILDPLGNGTYRHFEWSNTGGIPNDAAALTIDTGAGTINESPFVLALTGTGGINQRLALWHRLFPNPNGWESTLRYNLSTAPGYSGSGGFAFTSSRDMQGLRALYYSGAPWLFWHAGAEGQQQIYHLPGFDPTAPAPGEPVPLSLSFGSAPHHERQVVYRDGSGVPGSSLSAHRFSNSPFTYVRDPNVWLSSEYTSGGGSEAVINVLFTGYVRNDENTDVCWTKFIANPTLAQKKFFPRLSNRVTLPNTGGLSYGEELQADLRRQYFSSQHLEWVCHDLSDTDNFGLAPDLSATSQDPWFYLAFATGATSPTAKYVYTITWSADDPPDASQRWNRARNAYYVQPRFSMIYPTSGADPLFTARAFSGDAAASYRLVDPSTAAMASTARQPLTMEINPASGTVRFSAPLYDSAAPADLMAVLNSANLAGLADLEVYARYTPTIWRITRDPAADDSPWAFWSPGDTGSLVFFWRRSYSSADTPFEGRSVFMYRQWAPSIQVRQPPISTTAPFTVTVRYFDPATGDWGAPDVIPATEYDYVPYADTGYIVFHGTSVNDQMIDSTGFPRQVPFLVQVDYTGFGGAAIVAEQHLATGWTQERRVPIDAEVAAGPLSVAHESYAAAAAGGTVTVGRFWLAWASPRSLLDLRPVSAGGGDLRQSADVYLAAVVPTLSTAVAEPHMCSLPP
jgi:hypothetical protein